MPELSPPYATEKPLPRADIEKQKAFAALGYLSTAARYQRAAVHEIIRLQGRVEMLKGLLRRIRRSLPEGDQDRENIDRLLAVKDE